MKSKDISSNERGIAHLGLILLVLVVAVVGFVAYSRVKSANQGDVSTSTSSPSVNSDQNAKDEAAINSADQQASSSTSDVNKQETVNVTQ